MICAERQIGPAPLPARDSVTLYQGGKLTLTAIGRKRRQPTAPARFRGLRLEPLERRLPLAVTIQWANRGSDDFDDVFGAQAEAARSVVDHALLAWQSVFDDFAAYDDNVVSVDIAMGLPDPPPFGFLPDAIHSGCGGFTVPDSQDLVLVPPGILVPDPLDSLLTDSTPNEGTIYLGECDDGAGWFVDASPWEHSEFLGVIHNAFAGEAWSGTNPATGLAESNPARLGKDLYSVVAIEMAHVLGMLPPFDPLLAPLFQFLNFPEPNLPY